MISTATDSTVVWYIISLRALCCQRQYNIAPTISNIPDSLDGKPDGSTANPMRALTGNLMALMAHLITLTATNRAVVTKGTASAKNPDIYLHTVKAGSEESTQPFITKAITSAVKPTAASSKPR